MKKNQLQLWSLAALMAVFSAVSCKKEISSSNDILSANAAAAKQTNGEGVPFKGSYTTVNVILQGPPNVVQSVTGTGTATHLGSSTFAATSYVTISGVPPFAVSGTKTFTAANGDQFYTSFTGTSTPIAMGVNRANLHETITGGTGRFENASGSFETVAIADQNTPNFTADFKGTIIFK